MGRRRAFTLIELLVVIAIIAILIALLFPVFIAAKQSSLRAVTIQQMRQLGIAMLLYSDQHDGRFAPSSNYGVDPMAPECTWHGLLLPYVKSENVFIAPGTRGKFVKKWDDRGWASIGMNTATAIDVDEGCDEDQADTTSCHAFKTAALFAKSDEPAMTALLALTPNGPAEQEYRGYEFSPYNGIPLADLKLSPPLVADVDLVRELTILPGDLLKPVFARYSADGDGHGNTPIAFADGHVRAYTANRIQKASDGIIWRFR